MGDKYYISVTLYLQRWISLHEQNCPPQAKKNFWGEPLNSLTDFRISEKKKKQYPKTLFHSPFLPHNFHMRSARQRWYIHKMPKIFPRGCATVRLYIYKKSQHFLCGDVYIKSPKIENFQCACTLQLLAVVLSRIYILYMSISFCDWPAGVKFGGGGVHYIYEFISYFN